MKNGFLGPLIRLVVFAVVTVLATGALGLVIANSGTSGDNKFTAIFTDASLLNPGDDVRIAGVRVGSVQSVAVHDHNLAKVEFNINRSRLPEGVQAYIRFRTLTGIRYLALEKGPGDQAATIGKDSVIGQANTHPAVNLTDLFNGFRPLFQELSADDVNKLSEEIIKIFQGEGGTISDLVADTADLTNTIADKDQVIGELITNLTKVLDTVNRNDDQLTDLLTTTEKFVSGLAAQRDSVGSAITSVSNLTTVTSSILTPVRPSLQGSIASINDLSKVITDRRAEVEKTLTTLPIKAQKIGRAATFGSWFQFYLCGIDIVAGNGKSTLLSQPLIPLPDINHVLYTNVATRCWTDDKPPS
ncbi:MCE family protein [Williamsia deligens]|uniref:MCE family protein n=1 Tax=Williamsia deligens TaxID=321325 RepID=A0ABW3G7F3_9NOCA|nr:MCE family protein [Williamsia deligens]MCP2194575.1 phospholipid/cholesterol/gamma-HCH transport system substrate-binding protein [Williamsia deligens]